MSDHFGISRALISATRIYFNCSRNSGRTTSLVESLKEGDRVVFTNVREAERVLRLAKQRGVSITYLVNNPKEPGDFLRNSEMPGRTIFDHSWVENFYLNRLKEAESDVGSLAGRLSGFLAEGNTKPETMRDAKWDL